MANAHKNSNLIKIRLSDDEVKALRNWDRYEPFRPGTFTGDAAAVKTILLEALGIPVEDPHDQQSRKFAKKNKKAPG